MSKLSLPLTEVLKVGEEQYYGFIIPRREAGAESHTVDSEPSVLQFSLVGRRLERSTNDRHESTQADDFKRESRRDVGSPEEHDMSADVSKDDDNEDGQPSEELDDVILESNSAHLATDGMLWLGNDGAAATWVASRSTSPDSLYYDDQAFLPTKTHNAGKRQFKVSSELPPRVRVENLVGETMIGDNSTWTFTYNLVYDDGAEREQEGGSSAESG